MFEEFYEHRWLQPTAHKRSQLQHLLRTQTHDNIVAAIEKELPPRLKSHARKKSLRRRIAEEYANQPLPEATFETWHVNGDGVLDEMQVANGKEVETQNMHVTNGEVKDSVSKVSKMKPNKNKQNVDSYKGGDFDLYVRNKLVKEMLEGSNGSKDLKPSKDSLNGRPSLNHDQNGYNRLEALDSEPQLDTESDLDSHPDYLYARKKIDEFSSGLLATSTTPVRQWALDRYIVMSWGWDTPGASYDAYDYSVVKSHILSLRTLLHASILKKRWQAAYKVFSVLTRFEFVDKRAIWPLGMEILVERKRELLKIRKMSKSEMRKEMQFLEYVSLLYPSSQFKIFQKRSYQGPVFRSSSRTHAPISIITGLWNLMVERKYSRVREDVDNLMLHAPYDSSGAFPFLLVMCCIAENIHIMNMLEQFDLCDGFLEPTESVGDLADEPGLFSSKETMKTRIFNNNAQARKLLSRCDELTFEYPKNEIESQLDEIWTLVDGLQLPVKAVDERNQDEQNNDVENGDFKENHNRQENENENDTENDTGEVENGNGKVIKSARTEAGDIDEQNTSTTQSEIAQKRVMSLLDSLLDVDELQLSGMYDIQPSENSQRKEVNVSQETSRINHDQTMEQIVFDNLQSIQEKVQASITGVDTLDVHEPTEPTEASGISLDEDSGIQEPKSPQEPSTPTLSSSDSDSESDLHTKGYFSPTSSLPSQRLNPEITSAKREEDETFVTADSTRQETDNCSVSKPHGSNKLQPKSENVTFGESFDIQEGQDALSDSSASDMDHYNGEYPPTKKLKPNEPMEMEFDFDFE